MDVPLQIQGYIHVYTLISQSSIYLSIYLSIYPSMCICVCVYVCVHTCVYMCMSLHMYVLQDEHISAGSTAGQSDDKEREATGERENKSEKERKSKK